ncbi:MAG TPA: cytochrome c [Candidatus Elarobacter sp.]|jgi:mono/diheme cytochrome c family protein|nr:cytochrome c [Candidatus Elarobacter sp.]
MHSKALALLAAGAIVVLIGAGCSKGSDQSSSSTTSTTTTTASTAPEAAATAAATTSTTGASATMTAQGDPAHGKTIFDTNCATCHGAGGAGGGVGPSLKNEKSRKNYAQTVAWIKNPQPPMPKLYPSPLSQKDVEDAAAYVQTL